MRLVRVRRQRWVDRSLLILAQLAAFALASVLTYSPRASAQSQALGLDLQWNAPSACMSAPAARAEISKLIRADASEASGRARARVQIEGTPQTGYVAEIEIERGASSGERTLRGARCTDLADAAVLIIAMVIDPEAATRAAAATSPAPSTPAPAPSPSERPSRTEEAQAAEPVPTPENPEREEEPEEPEEELETETETEEADEPELEEHEPSDPRTIGRFTLGLLAGGDAGSLPEPTALGGLFAGLAWQHARLELRALAYLPQVEERGPTIDSGAEIGLYAAALSGCFDALGSRDQERALGACAVVEAGLSSGAPQGVSDGQPRNGLWLSGLLGVDGRQHVIGPLHLRLHAEVGIPILRPSYELEPFGRVFRASPVLGRFGISAFVLFP
jgi:hypothetical protein